MTVIEKDIDRFIAELTRLFHPEKVILFGSYAKGNVKPDSDVDILVLMDYKGKASLKAFEIRKAVKRHFPLDLIVRRPKDLSRRMKLGDPFFKDIMEYGRIVYERPR
jgi:predicted nucleotidyltransferase